MLFKLKLKPLKGVIMIYVKLFYLCFIFLLLKFSIIVGISQISDSTSLYSYFIYLSHLMYFSFISIRSASFIKQKMNQKVIYQHLLNTMSRNYLPSFYLINLLLYFHQNFSFFTNCRDFHLLYFDFSFIPKPQHARFCLLTFGPGPKRLFKVR